MNYSKPVATDTQARNAQPKIKDGKKKRRNWSAGAGLYLTIQPTGVKSWNFMYRDGDKIKRLNIGRFDEAPVKGRDQPPLGVPHTLGEARVAVANARRDLANNIDPCDKKKAAANATPKETTTVQDMGERFIVEWCKRQGNRSWNEQERHFHKYINPALGDRDIAAVTNEDIKGLLASMMKASAARAAKRRKTRPVDEDAPPPGTYIANRVLSTAARFFGWLVDNRKIANNPCEGIKANPERALDRYLKVQEIADVWRAADKDEIFGCLIQTLLLTGQRRTECTEMNWAELDRLGREWTIPGARTKNKTAHVVPLSPPMIALLDGIADPWPTRGYVFTTTLGKTPVNGLGRAKTRMDKTISWTASEPYRIHDIRHTVATYLDTLLEDGGASPKAILNHSERSVTRRYIHSSTGKIKRRAMKVWGRFLQDIVLVDPRRAAYRGMGDEAKDALNAAIRGNDEGWTAYLDALEG